MTTGLARATYELREVCEVGSLIVTEKELFAAGRRAVSLVHRHQMAHRGPHDWYQANGTALPAPITGGVWLLLH